VSKKLGEIIADRLEKQIISEGLPPGSLLGSEMELIAGLGCSRAVFREAVRLLERHGIVEMRRGVGGGLYVRRPDASSVSQAMSVFLDYNGVRTEQLEEARRAIETTGVESLARSIDDEGIARLREYLDVEATYVAEGVSDRLHEFHILIASLTGNPALELFTDSLTQLTRRKRTVENDAPTDLQRVHIIHLRIAEAIIGRDPALARHRMVTHLEALASFDAREPESAQLGDVGHGARAAI
jgi:DNA-binding FadR family transcriptional regulator